MNWLSLQLVIPGTACLRTLSNPVYSGHLESTKELAGMSIGVFQSREYIRSMGRDLSVHSLEIEGATFVFHRSSGTASHPECSRLIPGAH